MVIYFVRHASAGTRKKNPLTDSKRPLDKEGVQQCSLLGRALAALDAQVELLFSSPLKRALQTASLVGTEMGYDGRIVTTPALAPGAQIEDFLQLIRAHSRLEAVMVVGHNPTIAEFAGSMLTHSGMAASLRMRKGSVAKVELNRRPAQLKWLLDARMLRALYASAARSSKPKTSRK